MLLYRLLMTLIGPVLIAVLAGRVLRGRETWSDWAERMGGGATGTPRSVWLHGASNGELTSAKALVEQIQAARRDGALVVTCNTRSGRDLVRGWGLPHVQARLAPLDLRWALARFGKRHRPVALISVENELWPNRFAAMSGRVICVAARLSARSTARWAKLRGLTRAMLGDVAFLAPQDAASGPRFLALGLPADRLAAPMNLKATVVLDPPDPERLARLSSVFRRSETVLAASTHVGEDALILEAFSLAVTSRPRLRLILAPRHPARADEVQALITARGLPSVRHGSGADLGPGGVYLVDTLGEMALFYSLASVTFVGGSLVPKGGHTPFEPAQFGSAILHGPHVENFSEIYAALDRQGGAVLVQSATELAQGFADPARQGGAGRALKAAARGRLEPVLTALTALWGGPDA